MDTLNQAEIGRVVGGIVKTELPVWAFFAAVVAMFVVKWAVTKALRVAVGVVKGVWGAAKVGLMVAVPSAVAARVIGLYGVAGVLILAGAASIGYGAANTTVYPSPPDVKHSLPENIQPHVTELISKEVQTATDVYRSRVEVARSDRDSSGLSSGMPGLLIGAGVASALLGFLLMIRVFQNDDLDITAWCGPDEDLA